MNENNNRVQRAISAAEFATITDLLTNLEKLLLPYTVGLTPEERKLLPKINVDNRMFIQDCINEMKLPSSANIMPPYFKVLDVEVILRCLTNVKYWQAASQRWPGKWITHAFWLAVKRLLVDLPLKAG